MTRRPNKLIPADFSPIPSQQSPARVDAIGHLVSTEGDVPEAGVATAPATSRTPRPAT